MVNLCATSQLDIWLTICYHKDTMTGEPNFNTACCNPYNKHKEAEAAGETATKSKLLEENTMSINDLETKCRELRQLQALIEEAQAEAEAIKNAIKAHMGDAETAYAGEYKITWKAFTRETTTRRFVVA